MAENKKEILNSILQELEAENAFELVLGSSELYTKFLEVISESTYSLKDIPEINHSRMTKLLAVMLPDRDPTKNSKVDKYLLNLVGLRECKDCDSIKPKEHFRPNASRSDGIASYCKSCLDSRTAKTQKARQAKYKASFLLRIVPWTNLQEISVFYSKCPEGLQVDHIVPLQGELVSGLHVLENLQYLSAIDNIKKHNKFEV